MSERGNIGGSLGNNRYFWTVTGKQSSDVLIKYTRVTGRSSSVHGMFLKYYVIVSREKSTNQKSHVYGENNRDKDGQKA